MDSDQRSAAVMRTCRSKAFLAVQRMVADGQLADSDVPPAPDASVPCSNGDWDSLMFAWRARLLELQGRDPLGEHGDIAWASRIRHRSDGVDAVKRSSDYERMLGLVSAERLAPANRPCTPDPLDRTMSKRHWEMSVQDWRVRLRRLQYLADEDANRAGSVSKECAFAFTQ